MSLYRQAKKNLETFGVKLTDRIPRVDFVRLRELKQKEKSE